MKIWNMIRIIYLILMLPTISCSVQNRDEINYNLVQDKEEKIYREKVSDDMVISFTYAQELKISRLENGIYIHEKNLKEDTAIFVKSDWGLWMYNNVIESVNSLIKEESEQIESVKISRQSCTINKLKGEKIIFYNKKNDVVKQNIYFELGDAIIQIATIKPTSMPLETICKNLKIDKS